MLTVKNVLCILSVLKVVNVNVNLESLRRELWISLLGVVSLSL